MPLSVCLGRASVMDAWPVSSGEAIHTQTFLGHPAGCAAGLASIGILEEQKLPERAARLGAEASAWLREACAPLQGVVDVRGLGLMIGIVCASPATALAACRTALERGVIVLPSGDDGRVLSVTPPLTIERDALLGALDILVGTLP